MYVRNQRTWVFVETRSNWFAMAKVILIIS